MSNSINPTTQAQRRLRVEAIISLIALMAVATTQSLAEHGASERWRITINLAGMLFLVFFFAAFVRWTLRTDELTRKMTVESLAIAGGITALVAIMYGALLEPIGFPRPHAMWTSNMFIFSQAIVSVFVRRHYK
jgi:hypothetical protein